jgi:hypothetical protein
MLGVLGIKVLCGRLSGLVLALAHAAGCRL